MNFQARISEIAARVLTGLIDELEGNQAPCTPDSGTKKARGQEPAPLRFVKLCSGV